MGTAILTNKISINFSSQSPNIPRKASAPTKIRLYTHKLSVNLDEPFDMSGNELDPITHIPRDCRKNHEKMVLTALENGLRRSCEMLLLFRGKRIADADEHVAMWCGGRVKVDHFGPVVAYVVNAYG